MHVSGRAGSRLTAIALRDVHHPEAIECSLSFALEVGHVDSTGQPDGAGGEMLPGQETL